MATKITFKGYINYHLRGLTAFYSHYFDGITEDEFQVLKTRFSNPEKYIYIGAIKTRDKIELGL